MHFTMHKTIAVLLSVLMLPAAARAASSAPAGPHPWTDAPVRGGAEDFHFAVVGDRTCCMRPGVFEDAVEKLNLLRPDFVISIGDFIPGYTVDMKYAEETWKEFDALVKAEDRPLWDTHIAHHQPSTKPRAIVHSAAAAGDMPRTASSAPGA